MIQSKLTKARLEHAARLCRSTRQAADMLGVSPRSFLRACKREGVKLGWVKGAITP